METKHLTSYRVRDIQNFIKTWDNHMYQTVDILCENQLQENKMILGENFVSYLDFVVSIDGIHIDP